MQRLPRFLHTRGALPRWQTAAVCLSAFIGFACTTERSEPSTTFYDRRIGPILLSSCATSPTGSSCHVTQDAYGNALGNLSFESFDTLDKRRDLFVAYGPFPTPTLLLKALAPFQLSISNWDGGEPQYITTDIPHAGGRLLEVTSASFTQLSRWISRGGTENNTLAQARELDLSPCSGTLGSDPNFDSASDPDAPDFGTFAARVNPMIGQRCSAGNCHGSPANSLYLTCGESDEQRRWNYFAAGDYVSRNAENSELMRRGLDPASGGTFHGGGTIFESSADEGYQALLAWAQEKGGPSRVPSDAGFPFFANRVQPMLVKKGCTLLGCHSPAMGHDYRLRGGSAGHFGLPATRYNYELSLQQLSLESTDPNASRILRKNLPPLLGQGIRHRGGALFSGSGDISECDLDAAANGPLDEQDPYCVIAAWIGRERAERLPNSDGLTHVVYVQRPAGSGPSSPQDFERYAPGADLLRVAAALGADGWPTLSAGGESLLPLCGLSATASDVRRPGVSWDGTRIAFSARTAENAPWRIYVIEGNNCAPEPTIDAPAVDEHGNPLPANGALVHNFDPSWSPDGRIVFSSTRGNVTNTDAFDYSGPQRSPADPSRLNANLYVAENGGVRQLTFLLDQELFPSFMQDGRLIFSVEKRAPGFYQLAGRRQNLDGGDYHPLFGQRSSVGYDQLTEVVELSDKNLVAVFSERGSARGAGTLGVINRSVGIDLKSGDPLDYPLDPDAMNRVNEDFYQHSLSFPDTRASGRLDATNGAYLSPSALPNGKLLASYAGATDLRNIGASFALVALDPLRGERRELLASSGDVLWAVGVFARAPRPVFRSRLDEPNGATHVYTDDGRRGISDITFLDLPLLASLLFQNTRSGRPLATGSNVEFWEQLPPAAGVVSYESGAPFVTSDDFGSLYVRRRRLGSIAPDATDGSAHVQLPGGVPFNLALQVELEGDTALTFHHQREAMQFYPGEWSRQSFPRSLFNGVCGNCHGSVSGLESDVATNPDILTRASSVAARDSNASEMMSRGNSEGPVFP